LFYRATQRAGRVYGAAVCVWARPPRREAGSAWFLHNPNNQPTRIIPLLLSPLHSTQQILRREEATVVDGGDSFPFRTPLPGICISSSDKESPGATIPHDWSVDRFLVGSNSPCVHFTSSLGALGYQLLVWLLFGLLGLCSRPWPSDGVDSLFLGNSAQIAGFGESPALVFLNSTLRVARRKKGSCL
jgi:hypothetical protein